LTDTAAPQVSPLDCIRDDMQAVDQTIRAHLRSEVALINQVSDYIISAGGKRVRPALLLLTANALGAHGTQRHVLAAVVEFIHTATLLHDDVVDESNLRRGRETANAVFGNAASVLVGDFLYSRAFQMMVSVQRMRVMDVLADATNTIAEGEVLQLLNMHDPDTDEPSYLRVIRYKTARLFEASARLGAILADAPAELEEACATYGRSLGTAFQLVDDALDYDGSTQVLGKNVGDDLREGKPTMPLLYAMARATPPQRDLLREAIRHGHTDQLDRVLEIVLETGALQATREAAQAEAKEAARVANALPPSEYRDALLHLCASSVGRSS